MNDQQEQDLALEEDNLDPVPIFVYTGVQVDCLTEQELLEALKPGRIFEIPHNVQVRRVS